MGKLTISMAMFNSYVSHYQRVCCLKLLWLVGDWNHGIFLVNLWLIYG